MAGNPYYDENSNDSDFSSTGYDRFFRPPSKGGGNVDKPAPVYPHPPPAPAPDPTYSHLLGGGQGQAANLFLGGYIPLQNYLYANAGRSIGTDPNATPGGAGLDAGLMGQTTQVQNNAPMPAGAGGTGGTGSGAYQTPAAAPRPGAQRQTNYSGLQSYLYSGL